VIIESNNNEEVSKVIDLLLDKIKYYIKSHKIFSKENYDKIEGSTKVILDIETQNAITYQEAVLMLQHISNNWLWDDAKSSACTNNKMADVINPNINFIDVWFEDLD
jgi:hypothetical protein